jgi:hypothetical protein
MEIFTALSLPFIFYALTGKNNFLRAPFGTSITFEADAIVAKVSLNCNDSKCVLQLSHKLTFLLICQAHQKVKKEKKGTIHVFCEK